LAANKCDFALTQRFLQVVHKQTVYMEDNAPQTSCWV